MPKALDLTNQRFGKLVAISRAKSQKGKTYWNCHCDCGNDIIVQTCHLTDGRTKSCGCLSKELNPFNIKDTKDERICPICNQKFIPNNIARIYCYDCIPIGLDVKEAGKLRCRLLKQKLVEYKGGKCERCGYNKCIGALEFHHLNPDEKDFTISSSHLGVKPIETFYKEVDKCILLCANCHAEEHWTN